MTQLTGENFEVICAKLTAQLLSAPRVDNISWQSQDITNRPEMSTRELRHVHIEYDIPDEEIKVRLAVKPNLPWAHDHFMERISGEPLNPPPSEQWWPFAQQGNKDHKQGEKFSHTYPERFWPRFAAAGEKAPNGRLEGVPHQGIRYEFGDLADVIFLLTRDPTTRQAYLPVWFPEDTGNVSNVRVPCTLGYHFLVREGQLDISYFIRSCDYMRHFRDDVYMAIRLAEFVAWTAFGDKCKVGKLIMQIPSLHIFEGDVPILQAKHDALLKKARQALNDRLNGALG